MPRNFAGIMTNGQVKKLEKAGLSYEDIFKEENELVKEKSDRQYHFQNGLR